MEQMEHRESNKVTIEIPGWIAGMLILLWELSKYILKAGIEAFLIYTFLKYFL